MGLYPSSKLLTSCLRSSSADSMDDMMIICYNKKFAAAVLRTGESK
jgi:hypothetical protein